MHVAKLAGQTGDCHCHQLRETDLMTHGQNASACQPGCWWLEEGHPCLNPTWAAPVAPALLQIFMLILPPPYNNCMAASILP